MLIHALTFGNHTPAIVRLFDFNEYQWHTIHKERDVRTKFILPIFAGEFCRAMKHVIIRMVEVNQPHRRNTNKPLVKTSSQIIVIQFLPNLTQNLLGISRFIGIEKIKLLVNRGENTLAK